MPYITSSIIMQILTVVIPKLQQWQEQGAVGQRKITQWTRYLTIAIALLQSTGLVFLFHNGGGGLSTQRQHRPRARTSACSGCCSSCSTLTAGTALLMWMGEPITQRGIGNGMSLIIFASVVSALPAHRRQVKAEDGWGGARHRAGHGGPRCSSSSSSSSRASAASRCSSPSGWSAAGCTAARTATSRSRSTSRA